MVLNNSWAFLLNGFNLIIKKLVANTYKSPKNKISRIFKKSLGILHFLGMGVNLC
jgi:hypothetical protein